MNKNIQHSLLIATVLIGLTLPVLAETTTPPTPSTERRSDHHQKRIDSLKEKLSLTDDQVQKIKAILDQHRPKQDRKAPPKIDKAREVDAQISAILTPDQQVQYTQFKEQLKLTNKQKMHGHVMEKLKKELSLTDSQAEKVSAILKTYQEEILIIIKDPEKKSQLAAAREKKNAEMQKILSPDQMKKLEEFKKHSKPDHPHWSEKSAK